MKCSIINGSTISFDHLATPLQRIILDRIAVGGSCKIARTDPAHFAESLCRGLCQPGSTGAYKLWSTVCWLVIEAESGPITYWTLHSLWCLLKEKHGVTCNTWRTWSNKWKHVWFPCYSCRSCHKSQKCEIFSHTFCHKMHDFTNTMPSIGRHIPLMFCVRKFPIHYRLNDQNR